ncbi:cobalamin B12-binding domain-containing protein [Aliikangiella sp. IMCC44653]
MSYSNKDGLVPLSLDGLKALQLAEDEVSTEVTNGYFSLHPECYKGDPARIKKMCQADLQHHYRFLLSAMITALPSIFRNYSFWLKGVLVSRNMSLQHPKDSFELMKASILKRVVGTDKPVVVAVLDAGISVFCDDSVNPSTFLADTNSTISSTPEYTKALVCGDRKNAEAVFAEQLNYDLSLTDASVEIVQPAMYQIGQLWQENKITVAQEHLATAISQNVLARGFITADFKAPVDKHILCACIEGNHHALGLRMISDTFEVAGWDSTFLGADTPCSSILQQVDLEQPDVLALSISLPPQVVELRSLLDQLHSELGPKVPSVVVGGLALNQHKNISSKLQIDAFYQDAKAVQDDIK